MHITIHHVQYNKFDANIIMIIDKFNCTVELDEYSISMKIQITFLVLFFIG